MLINSGSSRSDIFFKLGRKLPDFTLEHFILIRLLILAQSSTMSSFKFMRLPSMPSVKTVIKLGHVCKAKDFRFERPPLRIGSLQMLSIFFLTIPKGHHYKDHLCFSCFPDGFPIPGEYRTESGQASSGSSGVKWTKQSWDRQRRGWGIFQEAPQGSKQGKPIYD
ncbi:hypothetical protein CsSME_00024970 [Camellia sinensis var. sinensis]